MATIIPEDGTGLPNANSYVSIAEFEQYASDRGITLPADPSTIMIKAMDWLLTKSFRGTPLKADQALHFPTVQDGLPNKIKRAQMEAAILINDGNDLLAGVGPRVTQETVFGAVSVSYSDRGNQTTIYPQLNALISGFLSSGGGTGFVVNRG